MNANKPAKYRIIMSQHCFQGDLPPQASAGLPATHILNVEPDKSD